MKRILKSWALVAAAAMGAVACQKELQEEVPVTGETVQVTFVAGTADTKTSVDASGDAPVFAWGENETFAVLEQTDALAEATSVTYAKVDGKANITAEFAANPGKASYDYVTIYPASGYVSATGLGAATLSLPAVQTMAEGSYDPNADLMVSEVVSANAQPTEAQMVRFTRMAAVVKMTLKNLNLEAGDQVEQVIFTADGKSLAGNVSTDLSDPHKFIVAEGAGVDNVTVNTTSSTDVYFTVLPTTLEAGDAYTVTVLTNNKIYIKNGAIPAEKSLAFEKGMVTRLGVDMAEVTPIDKWILVRDASTLKEGDVVAIVAKDYDKALSTKLYSNASETSTSAKRGIADITKIDNYLIGGEDLQQLTLVTGTVDGTFSFYDEARGKFLVSNTTGSTYLINQVYCDVNTSFKITIDGETTAATITNTEGAYKGNLLRYNSNGYFTSNQNSSTVYKDVCIYRLEGTVGTIPVVDATVTVPDSDESVVIAEEGAAEATAINEVVFNYVGDWTIAVVSSESWFSPIYADGKLSYIAEANTGAKREAVVTITASLEGHDNLTWTFNVLQKGAPQEISIVEFAKKGKDVDAVYKLTGIITEIPSSTSGKWKLADENGNTAQVQYLKTEAGAYVKGNVDVKVGDVISLTTVVAGTTAGLGGNSTYPSVYKGHYSLAATSSGSVSHEGGDVTVTVNVVKSGHIDAPTAISDSEVVIDETIITNYSFTDNGDGTATALLSFGNNETSGMREEELTFTAGSPLATKVTITVSQDVNPDLKKGWWLVTDVNDLQAGDKLVIAATGLDYAISTETNTNNRKSKPITKNGASLKDVAENIQQYALEIDANGLYSFKGTLGSDADKYIYAASSSSNYMKVSTTLDDNGKFTVAIASDGAATIIAQGSNTRNHMQYNNKSTSSPAFYCTDGSFGAVCLYKLYE